MQSHIYVCNNCNFKCNKFDKIILYSFNSSLQGAEVKDNYNQEACQRQLPWKDKTEVKDLQTGNYAGMVCQAHSRCCIVQMKTFTKGFPAMQSIGWEKGEPKPQRRCRKFLTLP